MKAAVVFGAPPPAHSEAREQVVGLSLVTRFVTLPMAVPFVDGIGALGPASLGLAAAAVVIQVRRRGLTHF